jgi:hypothetical protein
MTSFLNLCDKLDAEGVGQTVDALFSEITRSGHGGGFLLETLCAGSMLTLPQPRLIRCEQKEGMSITPGDIWLDFEGRRYEFPCKDAKNWTVELWMNETVDSIAVDLKDVQPGRFYELNPALEATQTQWRAFRDCFTREYANLPLDVECGFEVEGRLITKVKIFGHRPKGVILGVSTSPGDVEMMDISMLRDKLEERLGASKKTLSALPSGKQINCLTFDVVNYVVQSEDVFQALYGELTITINSQGAILGQGLAQGGLFHTGNYDVYSAVLFQRIKEMNPFKMSSVVFPHPQKVREVKDAFENFQDFQVVENGADVGL